MKQCSFREGVGEKAAIATVVGVVGAENGMDAVITWSHPQWVLWETGAPLMMGIDVMPSLSIDERKFIWGQADNGAMVFVELFGALSQVSFCEVPDVGNT